jgi:hypothetical protein
MARERSQFGEGTGGSAKRGIRKKIAAILK